MIIVKKKNPIPTLVENDKINLTRQQKQKRGLWL